VAREENGFRIAVEAHNQAILEESEKGDTEWSHRVLRGNRGCSLMTRIFQALQGKLLAVVTCALIFVVLTDDSLARALAQGLILVAILTVYKLWTARNPHHGEPGDYDKGEM